jgi:hypothetical protein
MADYAEWKSEGFTWGRLDEFVATLKEPGWNSGNGAFSINSQKVESVAQRLAEDDSLLNQAARREVIPATPTDLSR